ncbi:MAG TPA: hypothetical protein VGY94_13820 [Acidobacteriaceae bacterium]|nr:hypothetical protein [Acidobacteriaceae bacterium]
MCFCIGGVIGLPAARAQETGAKATPPPKVVVIDIEWLKPGKGGSAHQKSENAFIQAAEKAKSKQHYVALQALSGPPRSLFLFSYGSFAALEKERQEETANTTLSADIDQAYATDGELLSSMARNIFTLRDDLMPEPGVAIATMRYMQITRVTVRPGHQGEWEEYLKMLRSNLDKAEPGRHIALYQSAFGWENGGIWLLITPMKSLSEVDAADASAAKFREAMGETNMKHYRELAAAAVESSQRNLYAFDPAMSYASDEMVSADPTFWKRK